MSPPSEQAPLWMECQGCEGDKCIRCGGWGRIKITRCAHTLIDPDTRETLRMARFARKGLLPLGGGTLDQTRNFMDALGWIDREESFWRAELKLPPLGD